MPAQDELLLRILEEGSKDVVKGADNVAGSLDKVSKSQDKVADSADKSKKSFMGLKTSMADLKAGLDIVANIGGKVLDFFKESVDQTVKYAAEVRDLSRAIGASAEETSAFIQVADDVGVSVGTIEAAFKAAIKNGIRPNIETLAKLSDEYNAIQDPVMRSQFAMEKFGRAGLDMAKILEQGGDAIKGAASEARELGLTLSEQDVKAAREFEIQLDNMGDKVQALQLKIGKEAVPRLNEFFDTLSRGIDVANVMANGISEIGDAYEMKLTSAIATAAAMWGAESRQVQELSQTLTNYLIIRQQVAMTEQEHNTRLAMAEVKTLAVKYATDEQVSGMLALAQANQAGGAAQDEYNKVADQTKATMDAAAAAQATYRSGVSETIGKIDNLAMSLAKATDAQAKQMLAQSALDAIRTAQEKGVISAGDAAKATDAVLIKYGLATEKSLAMAKAQDQVNTALIAGDLGWRTYVEDIDKIPQAADDGTISMSDLNKLGIRPTTTATMEQTGKVDLLADAWMHIPREVQTQYTITQTGTIPGRAYGGPVSAGLPYLVGERGPEMFVPRQSGDIISNQMTNNYNITTDRTGLAFIFERQRQAQSRM